MLPNGLRKLIKVGSKWNQDRTKIEPKWDHDEEEKENKKYRNVKSEKALPVARFKGEIAKLGPICILVCYRGEAPLREKRRS